MKNNLIPHLMCCVALFVAACSSSTSITGSYKAPVIKQAGYKKIFIAVLTENTSARQTIENEMSSYLAAKGLSTVKSSEVFPPDFHSSGNGKDKMMVLNKVRQTECDGILTIALVNKETETRYVPGSGGAYPAGGLGYYGTFGAYYGYNYNMFYDAGYYTSDKIYYLETNLYDATDESLVWSAQSKTYDPSSLGDFLKGYEKALSQQVLKDGLMPQPLK